MLKVKSRKRLSLNRKKKTLYTCDVWGAICIKTLKKKVIYALLVYIINNAVHIINT